jgi:L-iditol 2-dehydrogenase
MLAAVYHGPGDLRVETVDIPDIRPDEVLIKVESAGICGTDLRVFRGNHYLFPPGTIRIPGHENVGRIAQVGNDSHCYEVGQKVFIAPNIGCGHCHLCVSGNNNICAEVEQIGLTIHGGFAEYLRVPAKAVHQGNVIPIDEGVDAAIAALTEPLACVLRGQSFLNISPGELVLILGAGPIGTLHMKLARLRGAGKLVVSEPDPFRRKQIKEAGADVTVDPHNEDIYEAIQELSHGQGAHVVIVAVSSQQAQEDSLQLAGIGGRISFFGGLNPQQPTIQFNSNLAHYKELIIAGSSGNSTANCLEASRIINSGKIDLSDIVTSRFPLTQAVEGFMAAQDPHSLKVVLQPGV